MISLLLTLALAAPDWSAIDDAAHLAAAQTDVQLCAREAEVTGQSVPATCEAARQRLAAAQRVVPHHVKHPHRSQAAVKAFKRRWSHGHSNAPCPESCATYVKRGDQYVVYFRCGACEVDHICALACGGPDTPENMRWLDSKLNRAKSDDCSMCRTGFGPF